MIKKPIKSVVNTPGRIIKPSFKFPIPSGGGGGPAVPIARYWRFLASDASWYQIKFSEYPFLYTIRHINVFESCDCTGDNVALGKPAFASTDSGYPYTPDKANDGTNWYWKCLIDASDYQWWYFDAEQDVQVCSFKVIFYSIYWAPTKISVQYSSDALDWTELAEVETDFDLGSNWQIYTNLQ